jgi:hypothetical protein
MSLPESVLVTLNDATLRSILKDEAQKESHPAVQTILAQRKEKPRYSFQAKFNEKGGIKLPFVIYRESAPGLIAALQAQLDNPEFKNYSK